MEVFHYRGIGRLTTVFTQISGVALILLTTVSMSWVMVLAVQADPPYWGASCFVVWGLLVGWLVGLTLVNAYPTIWVNDQGLVISAFLVRRVAIPWSDIIDVGAGRVPFGHTLVRARRITVFHRIYGWLYSRSLRPGFIIRREIERRDDLIREISTRSRMGQDR